MAPPRRSSTGAPNVDPPRLEDPLTPSQVAAIEPEAVLRARAVTGGEVGDRDVELLEVRGCAFTQVSFTGATFVRADLQDVSFTDCELSGCTFEESRFHRVSFTGCRMRGVAFTQADMAHTSFASCLMAEAWIRMAKLTTVRLTECNLQHADLYGTALRRSQLLRCDLTGAELSRATFQEVALHGSTLAGIKGADALQGVIIGSGQIVDVALLLFAAAGVAVDDTYVDGGSASGSSTA